MVLVSGVLRKFLPACALLLWLPLSVAARSFVVEDIRVEGLQRISAGTVFNYLPTSVGEEVGSKESAAIIRALYKTGFFKDVRLEQEGGVLVVFVRERPAVANINISGNSAMDTEILLSALKDTGLAEGRVFNQSILDRIEQEIQRQYFNQGKYAVKLSSTVTPLERNRVDVSIDISEGETATIKQINIVGNDAFDEEDLLDEFQLGITSWYDFFSTKDQYSRQKLSADLESLRSWYFDRGYINFNIESTQVSITPDKKDIYITVNVSEGDVYTISDIKLAGDLVVPSEELFPMIHLRRGEAFSRKVVVDSSERIGAVLGNQGYAFANVNSIPEIDKETKTVAVTFFVDPGKRVYVRRINMSGNTNTRDRVLRRELRQMESAWYAADKISLSRDRLQRSGFFEEVTVETPAVAGSTDQVDVNIDVVEKASGNFLAGVGYSQSQGFLINASFSENNFLGTGKRVSIAFNNSSATTLYQLAYTNPYYTIDGVSRGFNIKYRTTDFEELDSADYSTDIVTGGLNFGVPVNEYDRVNFSLDAVGTKFHTGDTASTEVKNFAATNGTRFLDYKVGAEWVHDSRNRALFPSRGGWQSAYLTATVPGSDLRYYKFNYRHNRFFPLSDTFTLALKGNVGYGASYGSTKQLPFYENFFGGGHGSLRGIADNALGPRDSNGEPLGGNFKLTGTAEVIFPTPFKVGSEALRISAFVDMGNIYDLDNRKFDADQLRYSTGLGVTWLSPVGALTFSIAQPFNTKSTDDIERFQFNLGTTF